MIRSFRNKDLAKLWQTGSTRKIDARLHRRILTRLDALDAAGRPQDMDLPGFDFHALQRHSPTRYTVHVNGPWCVTFEFDAGDALRVDFEQYH
jgi:proteic killer suppression protein